MKKPIPTLMGKSLICLLLLLPTTTMAMKSEGDDESSNAVMSKILKEEFIPILKTINYNNSTKLEFKDSVHEDVFLFYNFHSETRELKKHSMLVSEYNPNLKELKQNSPRYKMLGQAPSKREVNFNQPFNYLKDDAKIVLNTAPHPYFLYSVIGPLILESPSITCEKVYFWPAGRLIFQSFDKTCPINTIEITAYNNAKPILLSGSVNFSEAPQINLEVINATKIKMKFRRKRNSWLQKNDY